MNDTLDPYDAQDRILIQRCIEEHRDDEPAKLPPYLKRTCQKAPSNGLWVFAGPMCWARARDTAKTAMHRMVAVLPPERPYAPHYAWPVQDMDVLVQYFEGEGASRIVLKILIDHLLHEGACAVRILHPNYNLTVHK